MASGTSARDATEQKDFFQMTDSNSQREFEKEAAQESSNIFVEYWQFLRVNKKWWLIPIIVFLMVVGLFIFLTSTPVAPFIYTLF